MERRDRQGVGHHLARLPGPRPLLDGTDGSSLRGVEGLVGLVDQIRSVFTDLRFDLEVGPLVDGRHVSARWVATGTYAGGFPGAKAKPGTVITFAGTDTLRMEHGKFVEYWFNADTLSLLRQLQAIRGTPTSTEQPGEETPAMTRRPDVPTTTDRPTPLADRIGRGLLAVCGTATLGAFANGISVMATVPPERLMSEAWRTFAYLVFVGLFAMLVVAPRAQRGAWELVFAHKIAITVFALAAGDTPDAKATWPIDLALVLATAAAYVLCRGWHGWRSTTPAPATGSFSARSTG